MKSERLWQIATKKLDFETLGQKDEISLGAEKKEELRFHELEVRASSFTGRNKKTGEMKVPLQTCSLIPQEGTPLTVIPSHLKAVGGQGAIWGIKKGSRVGEEGGDGKGRRGSGRNKVAEGTTESSRAARQKPNTASLTRENMEVSVGHE